MSLDIVLHSRDFLLVFLFHELPLFGKHTELHLFLNQILGLGKTAHKLSSLLLFKSSDVVGLYCL